MTYIFFIIIKNNGWFYCYREYYKGPKDGNGSKNFSSIFKIPITFDDFKKDLDFNEFNEEFLFLYHLKLLPYLTEVFSLKKSSLECFCFNNLSTDGRNWSTGQKWSVPLKEQIKYQQVFKKRNLNMYFNYFYYLKKKIIVVKL